MCLYASATNHLGTPKYTISFILKLQWMRQTACFHLISPPSTAPPPPHWSVKGWGRVWKLLQSNEATNNAEGGGERQAIAAADEPEARLDRVPRAARIGEQQRRNVAQQRPEHRAFECGHDGRSNAGGAGLL